MGKKLNGKPSSIHAVLEETIDENGHKHSITSSIDVQNDHHFLDILTDILQIWSKCNHEKEKKKK